MYYWLKEDVALRAWKFVNGAMYLRLLPKPLQVERETFELLLQCDGEHDLEESPASRAHIQANGRASGAMTTASCPR